jgi:hybrid cluster-associated redox disulfide protein
MVLPCPEPLITKDTTTDMVLRKYRRCIWVFRRHGLTCPLCANARHETIEQAARAKNIDLRMLLIELNIAAGLIPGNVASMKGAVNERERELSAN